MGLLLAPFKVMRLHARSPGPARSSHRLYWGMWKYLPQRHSFCVSSLSLVLSLFHSVVAEAASTGISMLPAGHDQHCKPFNQVVTHEQSLKIGSQEIRKHTNTDQRS